MAMKRSIARVCLRSSNALACTGWIRQDSAACVSLSSIDLSKSAGAATTKAARLASVRRGENDTYRLV
jgi:hypothetical protein